MATRTTTWPAEIRPVGDSALQVCLGAQPESTTVQRVHALARALREAPVPGQCDVVPAYTTVTLHYRPEQVPAADWDVRHAYERLAERVRALVESLGDMPPHTTEPDGAPHTVVVPVWYGGAAGPDLAELARRCGLDEAEVLRRHQASPHRVCMLGFAPGFPFITGLDPALAQPRRTTPRTQIPPGSVAVAGQQTCIYPSATPGGWHLIGRTPLRLFNPAALPPSRLRPGDRLRFEPIDEARFHALWAQEHAGAETVA